MGIQSSDLYFQVIIWDFNDVFQYQIFELLNFSYLSFTDDDEEEGEEECV